MSRPSAWAVLAPLSALLAVTSVVAGFGAPLQPLLVGWFLLVCPGMAFVPLLRVGSPLLELALGAAVSIGLGVVVGQVMVFTDMWSPLEVCWCSPWSRWAAPPCSWSSPGCSGRPSWSGR